MWALAIALVVRHHRREGTPLTQPRPSMAAETP
jgi:hypothetical protein